MNNNNIPVSVKSIKLFLGIYLAAFLAITTCSIISTVVVLHVHHMGTRKVPLLVKKVVFDILARMLCMNSLSEKYGTSSCRFGDHVPMENSITSAMLHSSRNPSVYRQGNGNKSPTQVHHRRSTPNGRISGSAGIRKSLSSTEDKIAQHILVNRNYVLEEILCYIKAFAQEKTSNEQTENTRQEWMAVAKVLDRFFMCIFMSSIACSSFFVLIMLPMSKKQLFPAE